MKSELSAFYAMKSGEEKREGSSMQQPVLLSPRVAVATCATVLAACRM